MLKEKSIRLDTTLRLSPILHHWIQQQVNMAGFIKNLIRIAYMKENKRKSFKNMLEKYGTHPPWLVAESVSEIDESSTPKTNDDLPF
jgi:hypothetical protein